MKNLIFKYVFEKWIPFRWINNHKTDISRVVTLVCSLAFVVGQYYPQYVPYISQTQAFVGTLLGLVGIEIGKMHKEVKPSK